MPSKVIFVDRFAQGNIETIAVAATRTYSLQESDTVAQASSGKKGTCDGQSSRRPPRRILGTSTARLILCELLPNFFKKD